MKIINDEKYSTREFKNYNVRTIFKFIYWDENHHNKVAERSIDIYTTETDRNKIVDVVRHNVKNNVMSVEMVHYTTREQDEMNSDLIDKLLKDW